MNVRDNHLALSHLVGLPLRDIGRAANLLWLQFGEWTTVPARGGGLRTIGQWALHIQCDWSISRSGNVIISSADYYLSPDGRELGNDWDIVGNNRFDDVARGLRVEFEKAAPIVTSIDCDEAGDFSLEFSDESDLDVFGGRTGREDWRLFQPGSNSHFVFPPE